MSFVGGGGAVAAALFTQISLSLSPSLSFSHSLALSRFRSPSINTGVEAGVYNLVFDAIDAESSAAITLRNAISASPHESTIISESR